MEKKSSSWKIYLLFTTRRYHWSSFTNVRVLDSFCSPTNGNLVLFLIRRKIMHCRLMTRFVFMFWVFSVLVFIVPWVRKFPNEFYVCIAKHWWNICWSHHYDQKSQWYSSLSFSFEEINSEILSTFKKP